MKYLKVLFLVLLCREWEMSDAVDPKILALCISQNSCENCLQASNSCAWCSDWDYTNSAIEKPRCNTLERLKQFGCPSEEIRTTPSGSVTLLEDTDFQDMEPERIPIQLRPQRIKVRIPSHVEVEIPIRYRLAKNYPLDLYYLMDLTWTMRDDKETMVRLGWNMSQTLGMLTNNFRLGFGSYADKPVMPFVFPGQEENPCKGMHSTCSPVYSYWHRLPLTNDIEQFVKKVDSSSVTGNADNLEGGLDAIAQAIICTKQIGWGHYARKIILVATDGFLHFAGDGKLGGVVKRHDFKCHLDERGLYTQSTEFDYPSLAELSRLLQQNKVIVIFAVTEDRRNEYEHIAKLLRGKANVGTLSYDSSNILDIIKSAYHQITSKVILHDNSTSPLRVKYLSNCGNENTHEWNTFECDHIEEGEVYDFKVVLSFDKCPEDQNLRKQTVVIEDALASELSKIVIDVELLCGCNCQDSKSSRCDHGTNECGICKCDFGWSGETCDCNENLSLNNVQQCIDGNSSKICSQRGDCVCGKCFCDEGYKGKFCECSACDKVDGIECANKGTCQCGVCQCIEGWEGNACQCPSTDDLCIAPGSKEICAGHGYCDCGECRCNVTASDGLYYRGTYCESSISAGYSALCVVYNECVNATVEEPEKAAELCRTNITTYNTVKVKSVNRGDEHYCFLKTVKDERTTCVIHFVYEFQKDNHVVTLKIQDKICSTALNKATVLSAIALLIVALGVICLLIWKAWTTIQDKKEWEKFQRDRKKTIFSSNTNPLFKSAVTKFTVPQQFKKD
ncbi:integrin beta-nu-like [Ceratina calcarata]|uniref:Integrin beta n=1 Tax=Ceratina calcarata TaxID=156304 RepID=A0AAJ7IZJ8_9HYME|nr:integrin beta-nu-like [Ceratina calcarata]